MFDISFIATAPQLHDDSWFGLEGEIVLDDHRERFIAALGAWDRVDYERHWVDAARRVLVNDRTAFITSTFRFWWPMWRRGQEIIAHEQLILTNSSALKFEPSNPFESIPDYTPETEEGFEVSEWRLTTVDIKDFLARRA